MKITKEILESTVKDIAKVVLPAVVDEDFNIDEKAPYELYNAIVGTVFDEAGYNIGVRPVVSLKPGTGYTSGTGSKSDPYVVQ